jgi:SAM-dependent methyltransferase
MKGSCLTSLLCVALLQVSASLFAEGTNHYELRQRHDPNGIGKFYLGREIAHVMGHEGADWLERPERAKEENPDLLVDLVKLKAGDVVADIGAGTGYISWRMAKKVAPTGKILGVEIQQEMLDLLSTSMKQRGITNVFGVLGKIDNPNLPTNSVDLVVMVDVYHEFSHPREMMQGIVSSLKPTGRVAFVEYRAEDPSVPIKEVHKMSEAQVKKEAAAVGLKWLETRTELPWQHLILFGRDSTPTK